jgi:twitching motility protein PilT
MVRADGDALVMHVGERPIVVSGPRTIDLSVHGMNLSAMVGMLGQLLSGDALSSLKELGAVEHELPSRGSDHFSVVAARSGDDIWIEIRRRRETSETTAEIASGTAQPSEVELPAAPPVLAQSEAGEVRSVEAAATDAKSAPAEVSAPADEPAAEQSEPAIVEALAPDAGEAAASETVTAEPTHTESEFAEVEAAAPAEPEPANTEMTAPSAHVEPAAVTAAEAVTVGDTSPSDQVEAAVDQVEANASEADADSAAEPAVSQPEEQPSATEPEEAAAVPAAIAMPELMASNAGAVPVGIPEPPTEAVATPSHAEPYAEPVSASHPEDDRTAEVAARAASIDADLPVSGEKPSPALPVLAASAGSSSSVVVSHSPVMPMEPVRQAGLPADDPSSRLMTPSIPPAAPTAAENGTSVPGAPVTRTVRIEVPSRSAAPSSRSSGIDRLLRAADAAGASELFLVSQSRPYVRVGGNVRPLAEETPLLPADAETLIADVTPEPWRDSVRRGDPAEWLIELADVGRIRCSTFRDQRGPGANFHFAFLRATTADDLQLSADVRRLATEPDGLILIAGGPANDEAAMVAAFVDTLNQQRADYIITLEPQIHVQHTNREALISQREVGRDTARAAAAARAALREAPDVLVIEGVASGEMAQIAIEAAAQDRLVIASIDAPSGVAAVQRLIELVPAEQRQSARVALARSFRGAVAQLLLRKATGGRIAARELLSGTRPVARILADGDLAGLAAPLSAGSRGMAPLVDALVEYVHAGVVDIREAVRKAPDADLLIARLRMAGVDVSAIEAEG